MEPQMNAMAESELDALDRFIAEKVMEEVGNG